MDNKIVSTSKFLSYVLRHHPESVGVELDKEGWVDIDELIAGAAKNGRRMDRALIEKIVESNDKKRFTISEDSKRIRAAQGHSTKSVALNYEPLTPPDTLFHGTATRFLDSILRDGLLPRTRHHVHLSADEQTAISVGKRHGQPVILRVDSKKMHGLGFKFYQADNGVWLTDKVPSEYLSVLN